MTTVGCVCPDKQSYYDCATNRCVQVVNPCPNGYSHPTIPNSCQCNFPFLVFMQGQGCVCPLSMNNAIFQISTSTCVCTAPNTYMCNYVCVQCWTFSTPNSQQTGCVCIEGYTNVGNSCIQKQNCFNGTLNVVTGQCYCLNQAMYFVYSVGCICKDKNAYYSASVGLCVCLPNYYMLNGMCTLCWANSVVSIDMTTCICGPGFTAVLNTCVSITQCFNATLN